MAECVFRTHSSRSARFDARLERYLYGTYLSTNEYIVIYLFVLVTTVHVFTRASNVFCCVYICDRELAMVDRDHVHGPRNKTHHTTRQLCYYLATLVTTSLHVPMHVPTWLPANQGMRSALLAVGARAGDEM